MSEGEDPRRLPGGGAAPAPPEPVQVHWPQTVAVIFNPSSGGDTASERGDRIRWAIEETGKKLIWLETTPADSGQGLAKDEELTRRAQGVLVANLGRIQGGLPILPDAVPDDGLFDIAVLKTRTLRSWVGVATRILVRSRKPGPDVDTFRAHKVEIRCDRVQPVVGPGAV